VIPIAEDVEWLETDGLGGFAMGTTSLVRTRRYHGLLLVEEEPPASRAMLVSGVEVWLESPLGRFPLSSQRYVPDVVHPAGSRALQTFSVDPWPCWKFEPAPGLVVEHELFMPEGLPLVVLTWRSDGSSGGMRLFVRPLIAARDFHDLSRENAAFDFDPAFIRGSVSFRPHPDRTGIRCFTDGEYQHDPCWYHRFEYAEERARGLDHVEDLASPGIFSWSLDQAPAVLVLGADGPAVRALPSSSTADLASRLSSRERERRASLGGPLERAADQYLVTRRSGGRGIIAGYPWFGEWGRDAFIALRGLCLATDRVAEARDVLLAWTESVDAGMLPNRLLDDGAPEYNAVDASLWYVLATGELFARPEAPGIVDARQRARLTAAVRAILEGYRSGTRHRIGVSDDGLVAAGEAGVQLTWMDAKLGDFAVTPRRGKPVEIQALWVNALGTAERLELGADLGALRRKALDCFGKRFWCEERGHLYDVVDVDHVPGTVDAALRPNQALALGGLPVALIGGPRARRAMDLVVERLWTPLGPRSLAREHPDYVPRYQGGVRERDLAYHQGTVWPWLAGPVIEAWLATREGDLREQARTQFLAPLEAHLERAGIGHVSEIADAEPPHTPRGCPFQAWSVGELLRLRRLLR
jgi:predicted glycogen debranching enzyme